MGNGLIGYRTIFLWGNVYYRLSCEEKRTDASRIKTKFVKNRKEKTIPDCSFLFIRTKLERWFCSIRIDSNITYHQYVIRLYLLLRRDHIVIYNSSSLSFVHSVLLNIIIINNFLRNELTLCYCYG